MPTSTSNASDLPLAASRGRLQVVHLAVLGPEIPGANGAIGRSRPTPSAFCLRSSPAGRDLFRHFASQGADSRRWCVAHWLFLFKMLPRALPSSPHLSPLALWRPEALAQWNGDSLGPSPPLSIGAISAVVPRCTAAGTVASTEAVPLLACGYASLRVLYCSLHWHQTVTVTSQRSQVLGTLCSSAARLPVPGRCSDFALSRPADVLGSSTSKKGSAAASQSVRPDPSLPACVTAHHVLAAAHGRGTAR
jgi:hypothetical protein